MNENVGANSSVPWKEMPLLQVIEEIRTLFHTCFDNAVTTVILEEVPIDFKTLRDIRNLISVVRVDGESIGLIRNGVGELEQFVQDLNTYFLPKAKEIMGVSSLQPEKRVMNKDLLVLRRFAIYAFPVNIGRLFKLTCELKSILSVIC